MTSVPPPHDTTNASGSPSNTAARIATNAWRAFADSRPLQIALLVLFLGGWAAHAARTYADPEIGGLFRWIGVDFAFYLEQVGVFVHDSTDRLYSLAATAPFREALAIYSSTPDVPMPIGPVPYPPVFAWLLTPLDALTPPVAFAVWTVINALAAVALAWRAASLFPPGRRLLPVVLVLIPTAVIFALWFGQPQLFLAIAFGEAYIYLGRRRDMAAGLWLALFILKPQYLVLIVPLLLWKRRWAALAALAGGMVAIVAVSALVAGPASVAGWVGIVVESAVATGGSPLVIAVAAEVMVNWRALVLAIPLDMSATAHLAITGVLSVGTAVAVLVTWRGPWEPEDERFPARMTLLMVGTLLVAYHSHIHGVAMLAVPLAAFLAGGLRGDAVDRRIGAAIRVVIGFAIVAPWIWFVVLNRGHLVANRMVAVALVVGFLLLFALLVRASRRIPERVAEPAPAVRATA